jgi:hypothetical protein
MMRYSATIGTALLIVTSFGCPSAHADESYGPGSYAVPGRMPHGVYTASADTRDNPATCSFSTWTSDDKFIYGDSVSATQSLTADVSAPAVAKFITHGCTPWIRAQ